MFARVVFALSGVALIALGVAAYDQSLIWIPPHANNLFFHALSGANVLVGLSALIYGMTLEVDRRSTKSTLSISDRRIVSVVGLVLAVVIVISIVFSMFYPLVWRMTFGEAPPANVQEVGDASQLIVAFLSLSVAMVGLGLYRLIADKLKDDISEKISSEANRARSVSLLHEGYTMWMIYTNGKNEYSKNRPCPSKHIFLEQAMGKTREALRDPARGLDWNDPVHRRIVYRLKINYVQYATENWVHWRFPGYSSPEGFDYQQDRNRKRALACSYIEELKEDIRTDRQQTYDDKNRWSQFLLRSEPMLASEESNGTSVI